MPIAMEFKLNQYCLITRQLIDIVVWKKNLQTAVFLMKEIYYNSRDKLLIKDANSTRLIASLLLKLLAK